MERIKLTKIEKKILKELKRGNTDIPEGIDNFDFVFAVQSLTDKKLIKSIINNDYVLGIELTTKGHSYIINNPKLHNPVDFRWLITTILTAMTAIATTIALFIVCQG